MKRITQPDALYPGSDKESFIQEGKFLTIFQAVQALEECEMRGTPDMVHKYNYSRKYLQDILEVYQALPVKHFPVVQLRHVTVKDRFIEILQGGHISGSDRDFLVNGVQRSLRVSCWGVHIPPKKLESYRTKRFAQFMQLATERGMYWKLSPEENAEVRDMLANSPALIEDSRYGNFQFTFSTKDLLARFREQHCGGRKPVLRVLGTEAYKQELVHWILIHSPDCDCFDNLPTVDPPGPLSRDGNLKWAPESMTDQFTYQISSNDVGLQKKQMLYSDNRPMQTYDPWIWSNAVFAFYLPHGRVLRIDRRSLLNNVRACETAQSQVGVAKHNILRHPVRYYTSKAHAEAIIQEMKRSRGM